MQIDLNVTLKFGHGESLHTEAKTILQFMKKNKCDVRVKLLVALKEFSSAYSGYYVTQTPVDLGVLTLYATSYEHNESEDILRIVNLLIEELVEKLHSLRDQVDHLNKELESRPSLVNTGCNVLSSGSSPIQGESLFDYNKRTGKKK